MSVWSALKELGSALHDLGRTMRAMWGFYGVQLSPEMDAISWNGEVYSIEGVEAWVEMSFPQTYTSGGRIVAGGLIAGPLGAIVGSLHQKQVNGTGGFLIVQGPGFYWIVEFDSRAEQRAREFAAQVTALGRSIMS